MKNALPRTATVLIVLAMTFSGSAFAAGDAAASSVVPPEPVASDSPAPDVAQPEPPQQGSPQPAPTTPESAPSESAPFEPAPFEPTPAPPESVPPVPAASGSGSPEPTQPVPGIVLAPPDGAPQPSAVLERPLLAQAPTDRASESPGAQPRGTGPSAPPSPRTRLVPLPPFAVASSGAAVPAGPEATKADLRTSGETTSAQESTSAAPLDGPRTSVESSTAPILAAVAIGGVIATATIRSLAPTGAAPTGAVARRRRD